MNLTSGTVLQQSLPEKPSRFVVHVLLLDRDRVHCLRVEHIHNLALHE